MRFFLDSAITDDAKKVRDWGLLDGVWLSATAVERAGLDYRRAARELAQLTDGPVCVSPVSSDAKGMYKEAIAQHEKAVAHSNGGTYERTGLAYALAKSGQRGEARKILARLNEEASGEYVDHASLAIVHFALGKKEDGLAALEKGYQEKSQGLPLIKVNPAYDDDIRSHPRFQALLKKVGLPE